MNSSDFSLRLLRWYEINGRQLPWRGTSDPYRIWVSEIILQQTRVAQGYDYFLRFMRRFPDVGSLAEASEDEVLRLWQGLGYYSRARNLHQAARQIAALGHFPDSYEEIRQLRGVGDYTAAAIASLAFGLPRAVVDGNVYRVLARHFGIREPIDTTPGRRLFAAMAQAMLVPGRSADYNQAIMDFGAIQCTPAAPRCLQCPLADTCQALAEGVVGLLPVKSRRTRVRDRYLTYVFVRHAGHVLLRQRPAGDIWQGLYEPPLFEHDAPLPPGQVARLVGADTPPVMLRQGVVHQLTHQRLHADFYLLTPHRRPSLPGLWVPEATLPSYPVPRLVEQLLHLVPGDAPSPVAPTSREA